MAGNNGCPECQKTYGQPGASSNYEHGNTLQRTRTASPENERAGPAIINPYYTGRPRTPANGNKSSTIDRQEIIRRIKSGGSRPASPELERSGTAEREDACRNLKDIVQRTTSPELERPSSGSTAGKRKSPAPPASTVDPVDPTPTSPEDQQDNQSIGLQIERPRSALHQGDFRQRGQTESFSERFGNSRAQESGPPLSTSPVAPWHSEFPTTASRQYRGFQQSLYTQTGLPIPPRPSRDRAISNASLASSFVYKPPTSPLVQSSRPDTPDPASRQKSPSPDRSRRHTFSPSSITNIRSALEYPNSARMHTRPAPPLRSEKSFPYQAHQPRRSLNSNSFSSLPQTPFGSSPRRPSLSGDSPLQHAPMVGSYEESIIRGRMSTIPSRPLNFMAQIGVLGKENCKSSLRCPAHVSVPFPAVFYSYGSGARNPSGDQPSPYVGLVDLEHNLANQEDDRRRQRVQNIGSNEGSRTNSPGVICEDEGTADAQTKKRRRQKAKRRSGSPKAPPGGSYRIPQQGQLQIVIKNPNKTAVKLFLVPYDLSDMEPGQKTFIRQRSYSAGPIIDMPLSSRTNLGTDRPEAALNPTGDPNDRPMLRYLIHLHICCPSKGRYFLYKSVRLVFANRVPDGKERLRNEIQLPEPRYSTYKPGRDSNVGIASLSSLNDLSRRRSQVDEMHIGDTKLSLSSQSLAQSFPTHEYSSQHDVPMPSLPRHFTVLPTLNSRPSSQNFSEPMDMDSLSPSTPKSIRSPLSSEGDTPQRIPPLLEGPFSFQRDRSREKQPGGRNESLLSKRLMDLAFQNQSNTQQPRDGVL